MTISIRHKRIWLFRTSPTEGELENVAACLLERGIATQCAMDLAIPGSGTAPAPGAGIAALLHIYDPHNWPREESTAWCRGLGGAEYGVAERLVFDRSLADDGTAPERPVLRIGTQHRNLARSPLEFSSHWWHLHAPLVQRHMTGVTRYAQSYVSWAAEGAQPLDGFFESSLRHVDTLTNGLYDSASGQALLEADGDVYSDGNLSQRVSVHRTRLLPDHRRFEMARANRS